MDRPITQLLDERAISDPVPRLLELVRTSARDVPAYRALLGEHGIDPAHLVGLEDFRRLPVLTKDGYVRRHALPARCRGGVLASCDMIAVSSGSTGEPTPWPRSLAEEAAVTDRFEQVFRESFEADRRTTIAVVCFPLGTWVGGMFTASCCRQLAARGYPVTVVTPGNQPSEILRAVQALSPLFEQTVLLGYPPFLKDVVDAGLAEGVRWRDLGVKLVLAGEVVSEEWRELMGERAGLRRPLHDSASLYGTADGGVLGNETPLSIAIRRQLARRADAARALFGEPRLPTLVQFDPFARFLEEVDGSLLFSKDGAVPLVRYDIGDRGGVLSCRELLDRLRDLGVDPVREAGGEGVRPLPFAWVFGRARFAVSYYGANVFPEMVSVALEGRAARGFTTGKFVLEVREDAGRDRALHLAVELAPGVALGEAEERERRALVESEVQATLLRLDSEFAHYVPAARQRPLVTFYPAGHPEYFPRGVKHRWSR